MARQQQGKNENVYMHFVLVRVCYILATFILIETISLLVQTHIIYIRTPLLHKRMGIDGTYKTPSKELLRTTACSRAHELHHVVHHDNHIPIAAMTTGGKKAKAREIRRRQDLEAGQRLDDVTLRVPHVTFRGQEVDVDNTFDADLPDDISALSIHLDCHAVTTAEKEDDDDEVGVGGDDESIDMSVVEALGQGDVHQHMDETEGKDSERDCSNPVATTLHVEDFLMQSAERIDNQQSTLQPVAIHEYLDPLLPVFAKTRGLPNGAAKYPIRNVNNVIRPIAVKATSGHSDL